MSGDFEIETRVSSLDALIFVTPSREAWRFSGGRREASRASTRPDR